MRVHVVVHFHDNVFVRDHFLFLAFNYENVLSVYVVCPFAIFPIIYNKLASLKKSPMKGLHLVLNLQIFTANFMTSFATTSKIKVKQDCLWKQRTYKISKIGDSVCLSLFICNIVVLSYVGIIIILSSILHVVTGFLHMWQCV